MTDKIIRALGHEVVTAVWRVLILIIFGIATWTWNQQITRIDHHEAQLAALERFVTNDFVKKSELCELKNDVKQIQSTLNKTLPEISQFMGQTMEYMRANGGRQ